MEHDAIAWIGCFENDFINKLFFKNGPRWWVAVFEYLSQNGRVTRILEVGANRIFDVIEKGFGAGIPVAFGSWLVSIGDSYQKGRDFILGEGIHFPVNEFSLELGKDELIILHRIIF